MALTLYPVEHYIDRLDELKSRRGEMVEQAAQLGGAIQALQSLELDVTEAIHRLECDRASVETVLRMVQAQSPPTQ